jgi:hypothetical protein
MRATNWDEAFVRFHEPFDTNLVHFRVGPKRGDRAIALAYIDAREVMERLDSVVGGENWSDECIQYNEGVICNLRVRMPGTDDWIQKSDGSGKSDIEAEKGAISGALKRAAVKFGIGRYLYYGPRRLYPVNGSYFSDEAEAAIRRDFESWVRDYYGEPVQQPRTPSGNMSHTPRYDEPPQRHAPQPPQQQQRQGTVVDDALKREFMQALSHANAARRADGMPNVTGVDVANELRNQGFADRDMHIANWNEVYALGRDAVVAVIRELDNSPCLVGKQDIPF